LKKLIVKQSKNKREGRKGMKRKHGEGEVDRLDGAGEKKGRAGDTKKFQRVSENRA
jgi:hypothetical protein